MKHLLFLFFTSICTIANCQSYQNLKKDVHLVSSISGKRNFNFLKPVLRNVNAVMLGENMHGDGSTLQCKLEIIKYLHEELGYNVLLIECASFYQSNLLMEDIKNKKATLKEFEKVTIFNEYAEIQSLFNYISLTQNTLHPMEIVGFDCRHYPFWKDKKYGSSFPALDSMLQKSNIAFIKKKDYTKFKSIAESVLTSEYRDTTSNLNQNFFIKCIDSIQSQLLQKQFDSSSFWIQEIKNIKGHAKNSWSAIKDPDFMNNNARDFQMADNVKWLMNNKYRNKKVIISAHNFHIFKNDDCIDIKQQNWKPPFQQIPMGQILKDEFKEKCYSLGFISYEGSYLVNDSLYIFKPAAKDNLEYTFHSLNFPYLFIDFTKLPSEHFLRKRQSLRCYLYEDAFAVWPKVFDELIFIDKMKPAVFNK